jgi:hypothetical protein
MRIARRVRRCEWCGRKCRGLACRYHDDLPKLLAAYYAPKEPS